MVIKNRKSFFYHRSQRFLRYLSLKKSLLVTGDISQPSQLLAKIGNYRLKYDVFQFYENPIFITKIFLIKKNKPSLLLTKIFGIQNVFRYLFAFSCYMTKYLTVAHSYS